MIELGYALHYLSIATVVGVTSFGVGIGGGRLSCAAIKAINMQPAASSSIQRAAFIGLAIIETAGILGAIMGIMMIRSKISPQTILSIGIAEVGIALAIGIPGCVIGILSAQPAQEACFAISRQPFFNQKILNMMLLTQSVTQTPLILAFIIAISIKNSTLALSTVAGSITLFCSGLCIGLGSIGPGIGLAQFAKTACSSLGINRSSYEKILTFTFLSQAIIETPMLFALIISLLLLTSTADDTFLGIIRPFAAALAIGLGTLSTGINSSAIATSACAEIARAPEQVRILSRTSMLCQTLIDAAAIYALLVALLILFAT